MLGVLTRLCSIFFSSSVWLWWWPTVFAINPIGNWQTHNIIQQPLKSGESQISTVTKKKRKIDGEWRHLSNGWMDGWMSKYGKRHMQSNVKMIRKIVFYCPKHNWNECKYVYYKRGHTRVSDVQHKFKWSIDGVCIRWKVNQCLY